MRFAWAWVMVALLASGCGKDQASAGGEHASHTTDRSSTSDQDQKEGASAGHAGHTPTENSKDAAHVDHERATPRGLAPVLLDPARRQTLGVKVAKAEARSFERDLRLSGIVRVDETKQSHVHLKFEGFVEKVFINFVGRSVRKGEPLLSIYSPDLFAAEAEFAQVLTSASRPRQGEFAEIDRQQSEALVEAARSRLRLLDVPPEEIARLEATRTASRTLTIRSPLSGTVLERNVVNGMQVMPEMTLLVIADLREVWVLADVFENDLADVEVGNHAVLRFAGGAAPEREGRVAFVAPTLDEATRSAKVRIEVPNDDGAVRPGLFADVVLHVPGGTVLAVPDAAVIVTGTRKLAFVETEAGRFEPRELEIGARAQGFVEVKHGIQAGEVVAVSAQFLLDAESQIRGTSTPGGHGGH